MTERYISRPASSGRGFSLVELLVGMAIGLLTVLIIMQVLATAEAHRRTQVSGSNSQVSGALALHLLERDLRQVGYGVGQSVDLLEVCTGRTVRAYNETRSPTDFTFSGSNFAPVVINPSDIPAGDAGSDVIQVTYSGSLSFIGGGVPIGSPSAASVNYEVQTPFSRAGFHLGDLTLAVEPGKDCVISQISALPNGSGDPDECGQSGGGLDKLIVHNNGTFKNYYRNCQNESAAWNKPGGLGVDFDPPPMPELEYKPDDPMTHGARLYSLGPPDRFVSKVYAVRQGRLTLCDRMNSPCTDAARVGDVTVWTPTAEGIIALRGLYGRDADNSRVLADDEWLRATPAGAVQWRQLRAFRIAVLARSPHFERNEVWTDATPDWAGDTLATPVSFDLTLSAPGSDWRHYRHRVFETTVPLRNMIWGDN